MSNKFKFIDTKTSKSKKTHFQHTKDEIVLTLPDESGVIITTNTVDDILGVDGSGNRIAGYILKPDIGDNAGIVDENSNTDPIKRAPYVTSNSYVGPLEWTEWEACLDNTFNILADSTKNPNDKDQWLPNITSTSTDVYVRYRFHSGDLQSPWSDTIHYVTPAFGIAPFIITIPNVIDPLITTSGFRALGEDVAGPIRHVSTTWLIRKASDYRVVFSSDEDTINKLNIKIPIGTLEPTTKYIVDVVYHSDNERIPNSPTMTTTFVTPNVYIETPVLTHTGDNATIGVVTNIITGSAYKINNSSEPHLRTKWELYMFNPDGSKKLLYSIDDLVNKTRFDISALATNSDVTYQVSAVYYSENLESEPGTIIFNVIPFRVPSINVISVNTKAEFISKLNNVYNELGSTALDNDNFKSAVCLKWENGRYVRVTEIVDTTYAGPIVFITSDDFDNPEFEPNINFERMIIRTVDTYASTNAWSAAQSEEGSLTTITKEDIRSLSIVSGNTRKRYYFFYPLLLDKPYANKKHEFNKNKLEIEIYFEHVKFNTNLVKAIILPKAFTTWDHQFLYNYNTTAFDSSLDHIGSFYFMAKATLLGDALSQTANDITPYIFKYYYKGAPTSENYIDHGIEFYNGNTLAAKYSRKGFLGSKNYLHMLYDGGWSIHHTSSDALKQLKYGVTYKVVQYFTIDKLGTLVTTPFNITFKPPYIDAPEANIEIDPIDDENMKLNIIGINYFYHSYSPMVEIPSSIRCTDYNSSPAFVKYELTRVDNNQVVYSKTFDYSKFRPNTMPNTEYADIAVDDLELNTNTKTGIIVLYNTDYKLSVQLEAKNGTKSPVGYTLFNTGDKPPVIIEKPSVAVTGGDTVNYIKATSSNFAVSGLADKTHKATKWILYKNGSTTPEQTMTVTDTASLRNYTFNNLAWVSKYKVGVQYQASNDQWSEEGLSIELTTNIDPAWRNIAPTLTATAHSIDPTINYSMTHQYSQYVKTWVFNVKQNGVTVDTKSSTSTSGTSTNLNYATDYIVEGYVIFQDGSRSISNTVSVKTGGKLIKLAKENAEFISCNVYLDLRYNVEINFATGAVRHRAYVNTRSFLWDKINHLNIFGQRKLTNVGPKYLLEHNVFNQELATYVGWHPWTDPVYFPEIIIENLDELDRVNFVADNTLDGWLTAPTKSNPVALLSFTHFPSGAGNRYGTWKLTLK